jgi:hypothetical protein
MESDGFTLLMTARTAMEARLVFGLLESEGIIVRVPGAMLADEWAASMQSAGLVGTDVLVAEQHLDKARQILADFRAAATEAPEEGGLEENDEGKP